MKRDLDAGEIEHLSRLENALFNSYDLSKVVRYLEEKTFLKGDRFSFKNHEFQEKILSDTSSVVLVQKCAQVGMSEAMARYALAVSRVMPHFSVIMTMPHAADATNFAKTRLDPIINETPDLRDNMDRELDNSEVKGIGHSLLYMRGCSGTTSALSVPADMLIHDELDRSDPDTIGQYQSRIKHSKHKLTRKFGTPTLDGRGIALEMVSARRHRMACICNHCQAQFIPNFHLHVKIPGYNTDGGTGELRDINKYNLGTMRWQDAYLECPSCHQQPSLQMEHRAWVCENPRDNYEAVGYYVTPFEVPNVVTIPSLIKEITKYKTWGEFVNQALGETVNNSDSQLTLADIQGSRWTDSLLSSEMHCLGIDVGQICHLLVGRKTQAGELLVVHKERCKQADLKLLKAKLKRQFRVAMTVIDSFPETHLVHQMQKLDKNLYGGVYVESRKGATYEIVMVPKDLKEGKLPINQAKISRNLAFDELMTLIKTGMLHWQVSNDAEDDIFSSHLLDMTREQIVDRFGEATWTWSKSKEGQDHYHHTLNYLNVATNLLPTISRSVSFGNMPIVHRLTVKDKVEPKVMGAMR